MSERDDVVLVEVTAHLAGGQSCRVKLPSNSEVLRKLFRAMSAAGEQSPARLIELPRDGQDSAYAFSSLQLVAVETTPAVLIEETDDTGHAQTATQAVEIAPPELGGRPETQAWAGRRRQAYPRRLAEATAPTPDPSIQTVPRPRFREAEPRRDFEPLPFVQVMDFLTPEEQRRLLTLAIESESKFEEAPGAGARLVCGAFDAAFAERIARRLQLLLPNVLSAFDLRREPRPGDLALFAHGDGDQLSTDALSDQAISTGEITCSLFFHREPKPVAGGELRLRKGESVHLIEPHNNAVLIYPTRALVEVQLLRSLSKEFADSRFAVTTRIA